MEEASEIGYLENLKSEMEKSAVVAKERTPETLKQNFDRSMEIMKGVYYTDRVKIGGLAQFFSTERNLIAS